MQFKAKISNIKDQIKDRGIKLIIVTKERSLEEILEVYQSGEKTFGENKVQDLVSKIDDLPDDIEWHFIGHLQRNKVKFITPFVKMIHSVDSFRLLKEINKQAVKNKRTIDCLLEFHIASEESKFGLNFEMACQLLDDEGFADLKNVRICGVMGMATFTDDKEQQLNEFKSLNAIFEKLKSKYFSEASYFKEISMGMSDDYPLAIEAGSTILRLGSCIFGPRK